VNEPQPARHDYAAAAEFLTLTMPHETATRLADQLADGPVQHFYAKDILRQAALPVLPEHNPHVAANLRKIRNGHPLSPILLVRGSHRDSRPLVIADGYHRVCTTYHTDENTRIPCRIVDYR
jgi:hypothetical protein